MLKLVITSNAEVQITEILRSVTEYTDSIDSAIKLKNEFLSCFKQICTFPKAAKLLTDGTRQIFCRRYRIIYKEISHEIHIVTVIHSLRKYP